MEMLGSDPSTSCMRSKLETCHGDDIRIWLVVGTSNISGCNHGKVDNS